MPSKWTLEDWAQAAKNANLVPDESDIASAKEFIDKLNQSSEGTVLREAVSIGDPHMPPEDPPTMPVGQSTQPAFRPTESDFPKRKTEAHMAMLTDDKRNWCRWCLEFFAPERQKPRTIWERGRLRTNLMMADNGTELVCCDNCWDGAFGAAVFLHGQVVPTQDANVIPNPLLRDSVK